MQKPHYAGVQMCAEATACVKIPGCSVDTVSFCLPQLVSLTHKATVKHRPRLTLEISDVIGPLIAIYQMGNMFYKTIYVSFLWKNNEWGG